mmetsp:Transcript_48052/g.127234  ORF Transcript_48052/g.127234 Transcript_48052/m.127234 type:complete len:174 (-) Transcript_48052:173-694(-)
MLWRSSFCDALDRDLPPSEHTRRRDLSSWPLGTCERREGRRHPSGRFQCLPHSLRAAQAGHDRQSLLSRDLLHLLERRTLKSARRAAASRRRQEAQLKDCTEVQSSVAKRPMTEETATVYGACCVICFDRPQCVGLRPCKHAGFCVQCALKFGRCPLCRAEVVGRSCARKLRD